MERLVEVSDQEVRIDFELGCKCRASVRLRSLSSTTPVAFKVQTSSPHKFLVNPPCGLIAPSSYATFQVILKPQTQLPSAFPRSPSDRFLIKTLLAPEFRNSLDSPHPESINYLFSSRPHESTRGGLKLKVAFVGPLLLRHAVRCSDIERVRSIIKRQKSVVAVLPPREAESLLQVASESSNSDTMVNLLVEAGLMIDARVKLDNTHCEGEPRWASKGWTELHVAVAADRAYEVSSLVGTMGTELLNCRDNEGRTPLHVAASRGKLRCAKLLIDAGADVDARSTDGRTALYRAAANGDRQMVELLTETGADPNIIAADRGQSPLDVARERGHKEVVEILDRGETVLTAARRGEVKYLELLLQKGASANHRDQYGLTALHAAAIKGHKDAALVLMGFGSDLECQDDEGHRPLHLAVEGGSVGTVEALINKGANVNAKTKRGATPLYIARAMGYDDISKLLVRSGAASSLPTSPSSSPSVL